jgi:PTH2 family peptidyl-tRNA hydrolase
VWMASDIRGRRAMGWREVRVHKQVICYRRDLNMRKGKIAAQCAHASLAVLLRRRVEAERVAVSGAKLPAEGWLELPADQALVLSLTPELMDWCTGRSKKVVLSVEDEAALLEVHRLAQEAGLPTALIRDAGLTEFGGVPTYTAVAVGPAREEQVDAITGPEGAVATKLA